MVLVIAVAGASMAMESQRAGQPATRRPTRPIRPTRASDAERPRRPLRSRGRTNDPTAADGPPPVVPLIPEPEVKGPDLLRTGTSAQAKVISVVDERTIGPVTRSRLVLLIDPANGGPVEVTVRHAFPTPEARALVKVGGSLAVRYDQDDPRRVVIDQPQG